MVVWLMCLAASHPLFPHPGTRVVSRFSRLLDDVRTPALVCLCPGRCLDKLIIKNTREPPSRARSRGTGRPSRTCNRSLAFESHVRVDGRTHSE